ncbi:hypothetical protein E2C01_039386 [Portunus trituberculatus]|uniref:Uncharacterized protein n=1 Tax=Portunus trituberculatus TaxID=210409 RepID=A0A5B7FDI4_PORTR|nr:hypothetical protein [Portunus trituberculatus]
MRPKTSLHPKKEIIAHPPPTTAAYPPHLLNPLPPPPRWTPPPPSATAAPPPLSDYPPLPTGSTSHPQHRHTLGHAAPPATHPLTPTQALQDERGVSPSSLQPRDASPSIPGDEHRPPSPSHDSQHQGDERASTMPITDSTSTNYQHSGHNYPEQLTGLTRDTASGSYPARRCSTQPARHNNFLSTQQPPHLSANTKQALPPQPRPPEDKARSQFRDSRVS